MDLAPQGMHPLSVPLGKAAEEAFAPSFRAEIHRIVAEVGG